MKRWYIYALVGLIFGVFDWFFVHWLSGGLGPNLGDNPLVIIPVILSLHYGIWLLPIIPVVIYEAHKAASIKGPIFAGILTWCCAILSYYTYYAVLLSLGKLPHLAHLNIFGARYPGFWQEYRRMFMRIILVQILEWIPVAIIGGGIAGAFFWWGMQKLKKYQADAEEETTRN